MPDGVLDTQENDDKIGIEQRPMSGAVISEPEMMEDADTYVRRMMKSRGIEMPDMPNNDAHGSSTGDNFDKSVKLA